MVKSHVVIRRTTAPSVVEFEATLSRPYRCQIELERLLKHHEVRVLYSYVVEAQPWMMLRAKVIRVDGSAIRMNEMGILLGELRTLMVDDAA